MKVVMYLLRVTQVILSIDDELSNIKKAICKKIKIKEDELLSYTIFKESIDARKRPIRFSYSVDIEVKDETSVLKRNKKDVSVSPDMKFKYPVMGKEVMDKPVYVVGFGPAGMFSSLLLAEMGYKVVVFERGEAIDERIQSVNEFWEKGILNEKSNVQFGEGGAGSFSDGKLTTRVKDLRSRKVLEEFVEAGADPSILYEAHPHVGTDVLRTVVKNIRKKIISLGGEIHFNSKVDDILIENGKVQGIVCHGEIYETNHVILAIGHSARDTFEMIDKRKISMVSKSFAVGARIEHKQSFIDKAQFKEYAGHPRLGAAEYNFVHQSSNGRAVYTFCMCPGGVVVPSTSLKEHVVTNGMSYQARNLTNANSAILVQVNPCDFPDDSVLAGVKFQEKLEKDAYILGGKDYKAPAQLVEDFINDKSSTQLKNVQPSYALGVKLCNLHDILPDEIYESMKEGIVNFGKKVHGFDSNAVLTGVETRSSSPVRLPRNENCVSENTIGLYPCGEGAGFAGGIVSAAIDGLKCATGIIEQFGKGK